MTALGGFVDLGQIVFTMQAGALFGYALLWVIVLGLIAIIIYMEMCGRIAAVAGEPVFAIVRSRLPKKLGTVTLVASNLLNLLTCAAELGAIAIVLHLLTGWSERAIVVAATVIIGGLLWWSKFDWIERVFGLSGLMMAVFAVSAWKLGPDWQQVKAGFIPNLDAGKHSFTLYAYFAVGIFSAMLMEYEVHFYSSGAIEEDWTADDLGENFAVAGLGSTLGALLTVALLVLGALVFLPRSIVPNALSTTVMPAALADGPLYLRLGLIGILACVGGATIETALSGAYNVCQFYDVKWGKFMKPQETPAFTFMWMAMLLIAAALILAGIQPLTLVNFSIMFGMVIMPFTYYPILRVSGDPAIVGEHVNGRIYDIVGWVFFVLIVMAAMAALPLALLTNSGQP